MVLKQSHTILPISHSVQSLAILHRIKAKLYRIKAILCNCHVKSLEAWWFAVCRLFHFSVCISPKPTHHQKAHFLPLTWCLPGFWQTLASALICCTSCLQRAPSAHSCSPGQPLSPGRKGSTLMWAHHTALPKKGISSSPHRFSTCSWE